MLKIARRLVVISAIVAIAVGTTKAFFWSNDSISNNTFSAGTLEVTLLSSDDSKTPFNWQGLFPGDTNHWEFKITNTGDLPQLFRAYLANYSGSTWILPYIDASVFLNHADGKGQYGESGKHLIWHGTLDQIYGSANALDNKNSLPDWPLESGVTAYYEIDLAVKTTLGNLPKGETFSVDLKVDATQPENLSWE